MKWGNPQFLFLTLIIPGLIFFYIWAIKRKQFLLNEFVSPELQDRLLQNFSKRKQRLKYYFVILSIVFAILSLIRPQWGIHWEEVKQKGVDIIIALDVSKSMLAQDVPPNRLDRAKQEIIDLLRILKGDRVGLIAFAGSAFLQAPLTLDYGAVQIFLDEVDTDLIPVPGTAIGQAIEKAIASFDQEDKSSRVLILITDGEDHQGNPVDVAKKAAAAGIKIFTIGIGQANGAPIPNENGGFKKDSNGNMILTHLDEASLQKIALETQGSYIRSTTGDFDLERIYEKILSTVAQKDLSSGKRKRFEERFQWPLMLAFIFLILEALLSESKQRVFFLLMFCLCLPVSNVLALGGNKATNAQNAYKKGEYKKALEGYTDAQIDAPKDQEIKYNLANSYFKTNDFAKASELYQSVAANGSGEIVPKALYNLGNSYYREGKLKEAIESYQMALKQNPKDEDAKKNLEFVQQELKKRLEEMKKQQEKQQKQQQQQQKQEQEQKQDQKQDKNDDKKEEKKEDQKQEQQKQEQQKQEQQKQEQQEEQKQDQQQEKKEEEKKQQAQAGKPSDKEMTDQEAKHWLSALQEDRKKHNKEQAQKKQSQGRSYSVEKDW